MSANAGEVVDPPAVAEQAVADVDPPDYRFLFQDFGDFPRVWEPPPPAYGGLEHDVEEIPRPEMEFRPFGQRRDPGGRRPLPDQVVAAARPLAPVRAERRPYGGRYRINPFFAMQSLYGPEWQWRSDGQRNAALHLVEGQPGVVCVLPPAGGKTTVYAAVAQAEAMADDPGSTVVFCWAADEAADELALRGVAWSEWDEHEPGIRRGVCLVSYEFADSRALRAAIDDLSRNDLLRRLVFDDAHCVLSTRRLESMPFLWGLRAYAQLDCQRVFLSSTLPPCRMTDFCKWFLVPDPLIVREIGTQLGVAFEVRRVPGTVWGIVQAVREVVETSVEVKPEGLVLVYCSGADICEALQEHLDAYVSFDGSIRHREELQAWRARQDPDRVLMASTGGVCEGYHLEGVRVVVNVDYPRGMTEYLQRNGRICRDGGLGQSVILVPANSNHGALAARDPGDLDVGYVQEFLSGPQHRCLRAKIGRWNDGRAVRCVDAGGRLCLVCYDEIGAVPRFPYSVPVPWLESMLSQVDRRLRRPVAGIFGAGVESSAQAFDKVQAEDRELWRLGKGLLYHNAVRCPVCVARWGLGPIQRKGPSDVRHALSRCRELRAAGDDFIVWRKRVMRQPWMMEGGQGQLATWLRAKTHVNNRVVTNAFRLFLEVAKQFAIAA
ncbi:P-loop containing nucleoside triphosphate hydrolase protein [Geopyxis carbonaria]|nr:P-loop containing nucleoside triphosphate hydrolase protein [Geopyxis carbonaria]